MDSGAAKFCLFSMQRSRKRRGVSAVKAALQQEKQVGRLETQDVHLNLWNLNLVGTRLALMAGAASWQALGLVIFIVANVSTFALLATWFRATRMFKKIGDLGVASRCSSLTASFFAVFQHFACYCDSQTC